MAARTLMLNSRHRISHQKWENHFPGKKKKKKNWLISEDSKYNYIAERKIVKSYLVALFLKSKRKMLFYAN